MATYMHTNDTGCDVIPDGFLEPGAGAYVIAFGREAAENHEGDRYRGRQQGDCELSIARMLGGRVVNTGGDIRAGSTEIELKTAPKGDTSVYTWFNKDGSMNRYLSGADRYPSITGLFGMISNHLRLLAPADSRALPDIALESGTEVKNDDLRKIVSSYFNSLPKHEYLAMNGGSYRQRMIAKALQGADSAEDLLLNAAVDVIRSKNDHMMRKEGVERSVCAFLELHTDIPEAYALRGPGGEREYGRLLMVEDPEALKRYVDPSSVVLTNSILKFAVHTGVRVMHSASKMKERITRSLVYLNKKRGLSRLIMAPSSDTVSNYPDLNDLLSHAFRFLGEDAIRSRAGSRRVAIELEDIPEDKATGLPLYGVCTGNRERWVEGILDLDNPKLQPALDGADSNGDMPAGVDSSFWGEYFGEILRR